jgi:Kef-type K+ transport system membrane component KefB
MAVADLATRFFLAAAVILLVCRAVSALAARAGQPPVVGEMIAGVLLGPSLLGAVAPRLEADLFPRALLPVIYVAGQLGLVALMFQAGRELRGYLRPGLGRSAAAISGIGVTVPLAAGVALAFAAHGHVPIFRPGVSAGVTALFVGVTLAITAFPMLARIILERDLSGTRFGSLALACGGLDDLAAWVLLAGVLSLAAARLWLVGKALVGAVLFAAVLLVAVRPLMARYLSRPGRPAQTVLLVTMTLVLLAAWFTSSIGLYAVFGAFSVGLVLPKAAPAPTAEPTPSAPLTPITTPATPAPTAPPDLDQAVGPVMDGISRVLVQMFFTYSGLNTRFALLTSPRLLAFSVAAIVVAVVSKGGACWLGARLAGEPGPVAARIGALMNARGLMQLIALNVGLQAHLASPELFTSLVLVALTTTIMTTPVLTWLDHREAAVRRGDLTGPAIRAEGSVSGRYYGEVPQRECGGSRGVIPPDRYCNRWRCADIGRAWGQMSGPTASWSPGCRSNRNCWACSTSATPRPCSATWPGGRGRWSRRTCCPRCSRPPSTRGNGSWSIAAAAPCPGSTASP